MIKVINEAIITNSRYHLHTFVFIQLNARNHFAGILDDYNMSCNFELYLYLRRILKQGDDTLSFMLSHSI